MPYCDVGEVLDMLWVACTMDEGGAVVDGPVNGGGTDKANVAWTAGMVSAVVDGDLCLVLGLGREVGGLGWALYDINFHINFLYFVFRFLFFSKQREVEGKGGGGGGIASLYSLV